MDGGRNPAGICCAAASRNRFQSVGTSARSALLSD
jgi:hypothetical protein